MLSRYRSKVDAWFIVVVIVVVLAHAGAAGLLIGSSNWTGIAIFVPIATLGLGLPVWVLLDTCYTLSPTSIDVRCGPFRHKVPINQIKEIRPTRSMLSSPALSLDRLEIRYGDLSSIIISPLHREQFLTELETLRQKDL